MPQLARREPAYVRDEQALYIGTAEGNVKLCAAGTEGRVTALEGRLADCRETLDFHSEVLEGLEGSLQAHTELTEQHTEALNTHSSTLSAHGSALDTQRAALERLETGKLSAVPAAALPVLGGAADTAAIIAAYNGLIAALQACGVMNREEVT